MHIGIITPAAAKSLSGNRATALRWADFLRQLGHRVAIDVEWHGENYDLMVALHGWRSAKSIAAFKQQHPDRSLVLAMTGTDLYGFIHTHPEPTLASIKLADRLVTLHDLAWRVLPESSHKKIQVIHQSAEPLPASLTRSDRRSRRHFDICVVGHLRQEKDSLRAAYAVRDLPANSRIRIMHYGKAHDEEWASRARWEMANNPRYHWFAEVPHWQVRRANSRCHLMVLSSLMEGGANVISEAVVAGLPVIASQIDGSLGLLGEDYAGYYPVEDTKALRELLLKAEAEHGYIQKLEAQCKKKAGLFTREAEKQSWLELLNDLGF